MLTNDLSNFQVTADSSQTFWWDKSGVQCWIHGITLFKPKETCRCGGDLFAEARPAALRLRLRSYLRLQMLLRVVSFLKCIWTFNFLFLKTVEVKVHFWSSGLSVYCETVNWWCSSHYRLTVWIQPVLKYFSEFIYLFIKGTCYMKRSCVWNTNATPIFNAYFCVIFFFCKCLYFFALKKMSTKILCFTFLGRLIRCAVHRNLFLSF